MMTREVLNRSEFKQFEPIFKSSPLSQTKSELLNFESTTLTILPYNYQKKSKKGQSEWKMKIPISLSLYNGVSSVDIFSFSSIRSWSVMFVGVSAVWLVM